MIFPENAPPVFLPSRPDPGASTPRSHWGNRQVPPKTHRAGAKNRTRKKRTFLSVERQNVPFAFPFLEQFSRSVDVPLSHPGAQTERRGVPGR
jgi:hypothetical protein